MNLISVKLFFCRREIRLILFGTLTGGVLQILARRYIRNHPEEFLEYSPSAKEISLRGGAVNAILGQTILTFLAKHGLTAGLISSTSLVISQIPVNAISNYLYDAFPQNLPDLEKKKFLLIDGEKLYLDQCDPTMEYLFKILEDETIPFEERKMLAYSILTKYLNLKTQSGRRNFTLCIVLIFQILSSQNRSSFYIMMQNLITAIREGQISKGIGRLIVRRLRKKNIVIAPELIEVVAS